MTQVHTNGKVLPDLSAIMAEMAALKAENAALKARPPQAKLTFKIGEKGALSVYGMGRFPATLYGSQWLRVLAAADEIKAFIETNRAKLTWKD